MKPMRCSETRGPSADDPVLSEILQRLVEIYQPERIYLFGSVARGEADADSDYDLMVVVPDGKTASDCDSGKAYKAIWRLGAACDVLVWTREQFDGRRHLRASLPGAIAREGKLLYAA